MSPSPRQLGYVFVILLGLVALEGGAQVKQLQSGFRPFGQSPIRVPYSWDMFATDIERCDVRWDPPLTIEGKSVSRLTDTTPPIEYEVVYDTIADYRAFAYDACDAFGDHQKERFVTLKCARIDGTKQEFHERCP